VLNNAQRSGLGTESRTVRQLRTCEPLPIHTPDVLEGAGEARRSRRYTRARAKPSRAHQSAKGMRDQHTRSHKPYTIPTKGLLGRKRHMFAPQIIIAEGDERWSRWEGPRHVEGHKRRRRRHHRLNAGSFAWAHG